jgi:hypothetical protein
LLRNANRILPAEQVMRLPVAREKNKSGAWIVAPLDSGRATKMGANPLKPLEPEK